MGALSIAFDTTIVGALALPWVILIVEFFFTGDESRIRSVFAWIREQNQPAVAGVLLFAIAYSLGSAVSRIAEDFFNDDDLYLQAFRGTVRPFPTEDAIRTSVYCERWDFVNGMKDPQFAAREKAFRSRPDLCKHNLKLLYIPLTKAEISYMERPAIGIFGLQENALLLDGTDKTERLRQVHNQTIVLRGAAFNGMIAVSLCLFAWLAQFGKWRWLVPIVYLAAALVAVYHHAVERGPEPPFMEFTLFVVGLAGVFITRKRKKPSATSGPEATRKAIKKDSDPGQADKSEKAVPCPTEHDEFLRPRLLILAFLLTGAAYLAWWSTEVLYDQQVIYTYYAQRQGLPQ